MSRFMVVSGTQWQIPIIKKLKELDHEVLVINLYADSPAFKYSDYSETVDILDKESCLEIAKNYKIDAVITEECDIAVPTVAYVAEQLNLCSIGIECAELYTNKFMMREHCKNNEFNYPDYQLAYTKEDAISFFNRIHKKMIIKPINSNSSRGVFTIEHTKDISKYFDQSLQYSIGKKAVLCESYIEGIEFTVDGVMTKNGHKTLAISEKRHFDYNKNIACNLRFSYYNDNYDYDKLREINDKLMNSTGLKFGLTHVEYKYEDGEFILIEMGARGGGNLISSHIVPIVSGIDNYKILISDALGQDNKELIEIKEAYKKREAVLHFFDVPKSIEDGRIVKEIKGLDTLMNIKQILWFQFNFKLGDKLIRPKNDSLRIGAYIAYGNTKAELDSIMKTIEDNIEIIVE